MRKIKNILDIVDWGLCTGCGSCFYICDKKAVKLKNVISIGIRPVFETTICENCTDCLFACPGYLVNSKIVHNTIRLNNKDNLLIGPTLNIMEGHAADDEIRYSGSSGGAISALALFCLEKENMNFVIHTGMDPENPWMNKTVQSKNREDILKQAGSRYQVSSPCESLHLIEESDKPCVFIGRPCDAASITSIRNKNKKLDEKIGLVLTFFCAGTPSTLGTLDLLKSINIETTQIKSLRYRGNGWPGLFEVNCNDKKLNKSMTYDESWGFLNKYRSFRCQTCPDGLGELADISCGDAWHNYTGNKKDTGNSLVLARTSRGDEIIKKAVKSGYLVLKKSSTSNVIKAQGLVERRKVLFGRIIAMRLMLIPVTKFNGFNLLKCWLRISFLSKVNSISGTLKRLIQRGLWHRNPVK